MFSCAYNVYASLDELGRRAGVRALERARCSAAAGLLGLLGADNLRGHSISYHVITYHIILYHGIADYSIA